MPIPTEEQEKVYNFVKYDSNHGVIDAVAGSGKTTTIIESATYIDKEKKVLFCAFNKSIAKEISYRFSEKNINSIVVKTMHALGYDILKSNAQTGFYKFVMNKYDKIITSVLEDEDNKELVNSLMEINNIPINIMHKSDEYQQKKFYYTTKVLLREIIDKYRLTLTKESFDDFYNLIQHYNIIPYTKQDLKRLTKEITILFNLTKNINNKGNVIAKRVGVIDFCDMLYLPYIKGLYPKTKYDMMFIDECQDLSKSQLAIAFKYIKKSGRVLAVGDPSQSIYGFTGADIESFKNIVTKLPSPVILNLSYCFRCPNNIIELAQNFRKDIKPFKDKKGEILKVDFENILSHIKPKDLIISRTRAPILKLMFILINNNTQIQIHEDEIKEFMTDLKLIFSKKELSTDISNIDINFDLFFETILTRNLAFIERKYSHNNSEESEIQLNEDKKLLEEKVNFIKDQYYKFDNFNTLNNLLEIIEKNLSGGPDSVKLSTIHRAKGLENNRVFILNYDRLPLQRDEQKDWEKQQEKNLKYVALTRAKETLYLVMSEKTSENEDEESLFDILDDL